MATLKTIRTRITSVKNTQKITKAMKMVAAAKLRRAQQAVQASRPYAQGLQEILVSIAAKSMESTHPLLSQRENPKKANFLIFISNRGLCGGFNSNLLRRFETQFASHSKNFQFVDLAVIGKKGRDFYRSKNRDLADFFQEYADAFPFDQALLYALQMIESFKNGTSDAHYLVYNQFKSALVQEFTVQQIIPLTLPQKAENTNFVDFIYEPSKERILDELVPKYVATQIYNAHLESVASELGSRMTAMENATKNAKEMIGNLTLQYNRLRQAAITKELMDIVNGAESIK